MSEMVKEPAALDVAVANLYVRCGAFVGRCDRGIVQRDATALRLSISEMREALARLEETLP